MSDEKCPCGKRSFRSVGSARRSNRNASFRIRVYRCDQSGFFHVTNAEKGGKWAMEEIVTEHHLGAKVRRR